MGLSEGIVPWAKVHFHPNPTSIEGSIIACIGHSSYILSGKNIPIYILPFFTHIETQNTKIYPIEKH